MPKTNVPAAELPAAAWNAFSAATLTRSVSPVFVSSYLPSQCGLATFTNDLANAVDMAGAVPVSSVIAIRNGEKVSSYDRRVVYYIEKELSNTYRAAASFCNGHHCDLVSIQHEYGLYTGNWGEAILEFARYCAKPIVTTFHTLPTQPEPKAREIIQELAQLSRRVVVMAETALRMLEDTYQVDLSKAVCVPHGVHAPPPDDVQALRKKLTVSGEPVLATFGLLSPDKGVEQVIDALPRLVARYPHLTYLVVGATHPIVRAREGESYRQWLAQKAEHLGVRDNVRFVNKYLCLRDLLEHIQVADVCVTPYKNREQITSGVLAYMLAAGKATVSTPYLYAEEMAGRGAVLLADQSTCEAIGAAIESVLTMPRLRENLERRARAIGSTMLWENVGRRYNTLFKNAVSRRAKAKDVYPTETGHLLSPSVPSAVEQSAMGPQMRAAG
jgi:glycosyltransferase involved in cell wall biosynthesis